MISQPTEPTPFDNNETEAIANGASRALPVRFHMEDKINTIKSDGGIRRFDRWKDLESVERFTKSLEASGCEFKVVENERDDTIDVKVKGRGHPVYDQVEYIETHIPGDKLQINDEPVSDMHRRKYAQQYSRWKANEKAEQVASGYPLKEWPAVTKSVVEALRNIGFHTVEQLASASDEVLQRAGPIQSLKQKAKDFLDASKGMAPIAQLRSEMAHKDGEISALKAQMQQILEAQVRQTKPEPVEEKRGPGRPKKEVTDNG